MEYDISRRRGYPYYHDDFESSPSIENKEGVQNPVNIVAKSDGGGANSNVQYNNINIHIHLPETYNKQAINETLKQISENLGGTGQSEKKSKIFNFWRDTNHD